MGKSSKRKKYTFEDWKKDYHSSPSIPSWFYDIPTEELEKINQEQKRLFWERVEEMTERYKAEYQGKANTSGDLERLKKDEIEALTNLFYPDKVKVPILQNGNPLITGKEWIWGIGEINGAGLRRLREAYRTWVINGKRDYTYVKYNNRFNSFNDAPVAVIALKKYYDWLNPKETKTGFEHPETFEQIFYNPNDAIPCIEILMELPSPVIDASYNYIGKLKGVIPAWVKVLQTHKPKPLIKPIPDTVLKDLLNMKIKGLNLTKDASEFRKVYTRVEKQGIELDIRSKLSQISQDGKLGK